MFGLGGQYLYIMTQSREGNIFVLRLKSSMIKEEIQSSQI